MNISHEPTTDTRARVIAFSCAGFNHEQIAGYLDIDDKTLRKHYRYELDQAKLEKIAEISNNAYTLARNGDQKMIEFVLKTQGKWSYYKPPEEDKKSTTDTLLEALIDKL